jgi:cystathionine gamma-synthase
MSADHEHAMGADGFGTRAIHAGQDVDPVTGAVVVPISLATTFAQAAVGEHQGYEYARTGNPTRRALETCVAALEGGRSGLAFSSGMAALDAVFRDLRPGDRVVLSDDAYGGTWRLLDKVHRPMGVDVVVVDLTDLDATAGALASPARLVVVETPTNPALRIVDIRAVAELTHAAGGQLLVDNTFATPYLQQPLALGADVVVHSSTKYLGGHSDVVGGVVVTDDPDLAARLAFTQNAVGGVPSPFDCYLVLRGIKTLHVRMDRHSANAAAVARFLVDHPAVAAVSYPGLDGHPGHAVAAKQMSDFGGMVSFTVAAGADAALAVCAATRLFTLAESLGAVESLIEHPGRMTHASVAGSQLEVDPALVRLSVGLEDVADLVGDLARALASVA